MDFDAKAREVESILARVARGTMSQSVAADRITAALRAAHAEGVREGREEAARHLDERADADRTVAAFSQSTTAADRASDRSEWAREAAQTIRALRPDERGEACGTCGGRGWQPDGQFVCPACLGSRKQPGPGAGGR